MMMRRVVYCKLLKTHIHIAYFLVSVGAAPTDLESRDFIGDIINAIGLGLVTQINSYITVRLHCHC
jgi:hypothetical protein